MLKTFLFLIVLTLFGTSNAFAISDTPQFPGCPNPGGTQISGYTTGSHGIVGQPGVFTGSDNVFKIDNTRTVQCYCNENGNSGIQTNWWKVTGITQDEINIYKNLGWSFIPDGSVWGLDAEPYLAININNACSGQVGGTTNSSSSSSTNNSGIGGGDVLGAYTEFANTGTMGIIILMFGLGFILIGASILSKSKTSKRG